MSHSFTPLPQHEERPDATADGRVILWILLVGIAFWPRLWILGFWIFGRQLGDAFSSWVIPAIGFVIVPWTTLLYAWMWGLSSDGVHGWEWVVVVVGFLIDVGFWVVGRRSLR